MIGEFKVRDKDNSPDGLLDYCERNYLPGLALLTLASHASMILVEQCTDHGDQSPEALRKTDRFFSYILSYVSWIGLKRQRFRKPFSWGHAAIQNIPGRAALLEVNGRSAQIGRFLSFYYLQSENLKMAERFYGRYSTQANVEEFADHIQSFLLRNFLWSNMGWTDESFNGAMQTINQRLDGPVTFYGEENAEVRRFWNLAFLAEWVFMDDAKSFGTVPKGSLAFAMMTNAMDELGKVVDQTSFPCGLDR